MVTTNRKNWVRRWFANQLNGFTTKRRKPSRLTVAEALEDRTLLTAYVVDTLVDNAAGGVGDTDGFVSLREAIEAANSDAIFGDAAAGTGADTITFDPTVFGSAETITLDGDQFLISDDLEITGPDAALTLFGDDSSRLFEVDSGNTVTFTGLTLTRGEAGSGGAIYNDGTLTLREMSITDNVADLGGGVFSNNGSLTILDSTISNNTADGRGGGLEVGTPTTIINSTISGNSAGGRGGGIANFFGSTIVVNSTITGNRSDANDSGGEIGGGIDNATLNMASTFTTIHNTIVAGNFIGSGTTPNDVGGGKALEAASSNNLIGDSATAGGLTDGTDGNIVGVGGAGVRDIATILDTNLQNNGGSTPTHLLADGSLAINSGDDALALDENDVALTTDQRGEARFDGTVDMGAVEMYSPLVVSTLDDESDGDFSNGDLSLREAIEIANGRGGSEEIIFGRGISGTITLGGTQLEVSDDVIITGPGANVLTIDADDQSRIFNIFGDEGTITVGISGLSLTGGNGDGFGGAIAVTEADLALENMSMFGNTADSGGGAIDNFSANTTIIGSSLYNNSTPSVGGAINNEEATLLVVNSTISGNMADNSGAGIYNSFDADATIVNSTITLNTADANDQTDGEEEDALNGELGGGIFIDSGIVTTYNTIVAGNVYGTATPVANDIEGTLEVGSANNLIGDAASAGGLTDATGGNIVGVGGAGVRDISSILDTQLLNNGGTTRTHGLVNGSAALNNGADNRATEDGEIGSTALTGDQRGQNRFDGTVDIGAFEGTVFGPDDYGNAYEYAHALNIPDYIEGGLDYIDDQDWFAVDLEEGKTYVFTTTVDELSDTIIELYDTDGMTQLTENDDYIFVDTEGNLASRLTFTAQTTGTYYLVVVSYPDAEEVGSYSLTAKQLVDDVAGWNSTTGRWYYGENVDGTISQEIGPLWGPGAGWDIHQGDFDGDGIEDIAGRTDSGEWYVINGRTGASEYWGAWGTDANHRWNDEAVQGIVEVADFDGDGYDDILGKNWKGEFYVSFSDGESFSPTTYWGRVSQLTWVNHEVGDFNGDGLPDLVHFRENGQRWVNENNGDGSGFTLDYYGAVGTQATAQWENFMVGDWNGDGYDDIIQQDFFGQWWIGYSNGLEDGAFDTMFANRWQPDAFEEFHVGDFNGDGREEFVGRSTSNQLWVNRSLENGRMNPEFFNAWSAAATFTMTTGDFNGDGMTDVAGVRQSDGAWFLQQSTGTGSGPVGRAVGSFFGSWSNFTGSNEIFTAFNDNDDEPILV